MSPAVPPPPPLPRRRVPPPLPALPAWAHPPGYRDAGGGGGDGTAPRRKRRRRWPWVLLLIFVGTPLIAAFAVMLYAHGLRTEIPDIYALRRDATASSSTAYTADGIVLARYHHLHRRWVPLDAVAKSFVDALVATEDKRFYEHEGVDWERFAASIYLTARGRTQGGSTLTMQLARNLFPEEIGTTQSLRRKAKEILTAQRIEQAYSKAEIIEMYVNTMPFGLNAFGVEAASQVYFSTSAADIDIGQAALLVAVLKGTTRYNPVRNPGLATERRRLVLERMVTAGTLSPSAAIDIGASPLELDLQTTRPSDSPAPHFADYVATWVQAWCAAHDCDLYTGGLRIYTTLDSRLQALATETVTAQADALDRVAGYEWSSAGAGTVGSVEAARTSRPYAYFWDRYGRVVDGYVRETPRYRSAVAGGASADGALARLRGNASFMDSLRTARMRLEVGFVALEPQTGFVRAWVGGRDHGIDQYDHVAQARRQPGSTFKAFVYTAAIDWGLRPDDPFRDVVRSYNDGGGRTWTPTNSGGGASGATLTLRQALTYSKNTVTAQITNKIGPGYVARIAHRMGIASPLREVPSLGLGTSEVTLLELVSAYGTLSDGGVHHAPIVVTRIEDRDGHVIADFAPVGERAIGSGVAYTVLDMLRGVIDKGTGSRLRSRYDLRGDLAGKTGTTQENADGWFVALTTRMAVGAWVGFNDRRVAFRSMAWGQGGAGALSVVGSTLSRIEATGGAPPDSERFQRPPGFEGLGAGRGDESDDGPDDPEDLFGGAFNPDRAPTESEPAWAPWTDPSPSRDPDARPGALDPSDPRTGDPRSSTPRSADPRTMDPPRPSGAATRPPTPRPPITVPPVEIPPAPPTVGAPDRRPAPTRTAPRTLPADTTARRRPPARVGW